MKILQSVAVNWTVAGHQTPQQRVRMQCKKYAQKTKYIRYKYDIVYLSNNYGTDSKVYNFFFETAKTLIPMSD
jgi:hypothetical protein